MGAAKRLKNHDNLRGTPTSDQGGSGPSDLKRGLKGDMGAGGRHKMTTFFLNPHDNTVAGRVPTVHDGVTTVVTGDAGASGGATNAFVGRGTSTNNGDQRTVLDSDTAPLGVDVENAVLATFAVATGAGAAGTFTVTGENTGNIMRVEVYVRGADTDEEGALILVDYVAADGTAKTIGPLSGEGFVNGNTVVVYGQDTDATTEAAVRSSGQFFRTRRTVATVA